MYTIHWPPYWRIGASTHGAPVTARLFQTETGGYKFAARRFVLELDLDCQPRDKRLAHPLEPLGWSTIDFEFSLSLPRSSERRKW